ncbi:DUF58 family [Commensalibacter communis]|uniref:DUF58 family n=1 Tax=Commensalibacter communis TaxID=2972786 RepID=A0A9W4X5K6_9PROT|nr:DUF58 domain-containing protein [Commensalibacter communis]CAI3923773.1 DUF58 family [Commensalibacter communis]CAI3925254.1 DUF58 family [Commensalibacter communis]CAI3937183.1 DUF58 family [Commensalibacter communis]CAI3937740.1 DUF58 family [Commensalibacter communis]
MVKDSWWSQFLQKTLHKNSQGSSTSASSRPDHTTSLNSIVPSSEHLAQSLPDLLLASHRIARTVLAGSHGCKRSGQGSQFWQYRHALPGESIQTIDWRKSAQSNKAYVKETEEENTQTLYLWCDVSGSMQWHSRPDLPTKQNRAFLLGLTLSSLLLSGGERVKLLLPNQQINSFRGTHQLYPLAEQLTQSEASSANPFPMPEYVSPHAWTVLISDFLYPYEKLAEFLKQMAQRPSNILLIQVTDPAEKELPFKGRIQFTGLEGEEGLILSNNKQSSANYKELWTDHQHKLKRLSQNVGIPMLCDFSDRNAAQILLQAWNILSNKSNSRLT